jgi:hypothetical protein
MNRHSITAKTIKGSGHYETTHFQAAPATNNDVWIIAKKYDRLDLLANRYYGDRSLWWVIAVANDFVNGSIVIPMGKRIRIPSNVNDFLKSADKSTFDIKGKDAGGLPTGLGGY